MLLLVGFYRFKDCLPLTAVSLVVCQSLDMHVYLGTIGIAYGQQTRVTGATGPKKVVTFILKEIKAIKKECRPCRRCSPSNLRPYWDRRYSFAEIWSKGIPI